ncbi:DNA-processing protein DprA [Roseobacter sp. OBYS 0001]|uniref:DNA-processing protein DprA n=1 Tax=Roseobacter sp. OBYS 0001 TaxID=882651 RepID=UPI001BC7CBB3|nr:DNA-processing protein DprA [Roseobacter sp. OBYS 0001]GIT85200.1 DNA processing protein DprA [Roseobacter sp. OBYS 0001]
MTDRDHNPSSTHPPLPPTSEDEQFSRLRLLRSRRVGIATYKRLLTEHGTAQNALAALPEVARAAGVEKYEICPEAVIQTELNKAHAAQARLVMQGTDAYPKLLNELQDAPPFLWVIGDVELLKKPMVSLVGARNASSLGTRMARALARDLGAAGYTVVSGLARGVDAAAHNAALETGTIAVQAGGVDVIYPAENTELALSMAEHGLRVSEQPMGLQPMARHFPSRNRIIAGLSQATVVVEAAAKSGSLITARDALDQGRDVLAVPGNPFDARAAGCNQLIRDGATLIRSAADVIETLSPMHHDAPQLPIPAPTPRRDSPPPAKMKTKLKQAAALHRQILSRLSPAPVPEDQLIRDLAVTASEAAPALLDLEMDGQITRQSGGMLSRS